MTNNREDTMHEGLRAWMKAKGTGPKQVARDLNYSGGYIDRLLSGVDPISPPFLTRFKLKYGRSAMVEAFGEEVAER